MRAHAGVDHGDPDTFAGGLVPGRWCANAAGGVIQVPLLRIERVAGHEHRLHQTIGLGVFDIRVAGTKMGRHGFHLLVRQRAAELEDLGTLNGSPKGGDFDALDRGAGGRRHL